MSRRCVYWGGQSEGAWAQALLALVLPELPLPALLILQVGNDRPRAKS